MIFWKLYNIKSADYYFDGNHVIDCIGKLISEFANSGKDKLLGIYDADIIIGGGVWIGANATILLGVHFAEVCVISAGAEVSKNNTLWNIWWNSCKTD